jgi:hypothetical protein
LLYLSMFREMQRVRGATDEETTQLRMHAELQTTIANRTPESGELLFGATGEQPTEDGVDLTPALSVDIRDFDIQWLRHGNNPNLSDGAPRLLPAADWKDFRLSQNRKLCLVVLRPYHGIIVSIDRAMGGGN